MAEPERPAGDNDPVPSASAQPAVGGHHSSNNDANISLDAGYREGDTNVAIPAPSSSAAAPTTTAATNSAPITLPSVSNLTSAPPQPTRSNPMSMSSLLSGDHKPAFDKPPTPAPSSWSHEALFPEDRVQPGQDHRSPSLPSMSRMPEPPRRPNTNIPPPPNSVPLSGPTSRDSLSKSAPFEFSRTSYLPNQLSASQPRVSTGPPPPSANPKPPNVYSSAPPPPPPPPQQRKPNQPPQPYNQKKDTPAPSWGWRDAPGQQVPPPSQSQQQLAQSSKSASHTVTSRPGYFVADPQRDSEVPNAQTAHYHHYHHRYAVNDPVSVKSPPQPSPQRMEGQLPSLSGWAPPIHTAPPVLHPGSPVVDLKRKRNNLDEGAQPHRHHHHVHHIHPNQQQPPVLVEHPSYAPSFTQPVAAPAIKKAELPLFTDQQVLFAARAPFPNAYTKSVANVLARPEIEAGKSNFLGQFVWHPHQDPAKLMDGNLLRQHVGARFEVLVDAQWLGATPFSLSTDPSIIYQMRTDDADWCLWDLQPIANCKIWGSGIYTDDSDPLAAAIHSGALLLYPDSMKPTKLGHGKPYRLKLCMRVLPKLINYQGSSQAGIDSRSWGNSHDGVSIYIDKVLLVEDSDARDAARKPSRIVGRKAKQQEHLSESRETVTDDFGVVELPFTGPGSLKYTAPLAYALNMGLLTDASGNQPNGLHQLLQKYSLNLHGSETTKLRAVPDSSTFLLGSQETPLDASLLRWTHDGLRTNGTQIPLQSISVDV